MFSRGTTVNLFLLGFWRQTMWVTGFPNTSSNLQTCWLDTASLETTAPQAILGSSLTTKTLQFVRNRCCLLAGKQWCNYFFWTLVCMFWSGMWLLQFGALRKMTLQKLTPRPETLGDRHHSLHRQICVAWVPQLHRSLLLGVFCLSWKKNSYHYESVCSTNWYNSHACFLRPKLEIHCTPHHKPWPQFSKYGREGFWLFFTISQKINEKLTVSDMKVHRLSEQKSFT